MKIPGFVIVLHFSVPCSLGFCFSDTCVVEILCDGLTLPCAACVQLCSVGSLKWDLVGVFLPWKWANPTGQGPPPTSPLLCVSSSLSQTPEIRKTYVAMTSDAH